MEAFILAFVFMAAIALGECCGVLHNDHED